MAASSALVASSANTHCGAFNGSLRAALAYPEEPERYTDDALQKALRDALLPDLVNRLDDASQPQQARVEGGGEFTDHLGPCAALNTPVPPSAPPP